MLEPITADNLTILPGIRHGFFTREGGSSRGIYAGLNCGLGSSDDRVTVLENRARVAEHLGAHSDEVVTLYQTHSAIALTVSDVPSRGETLPNADAIVTKTRGLAIGVLTADCTPVLFAEPDARIVAAAHAGWRGAVGGILEATIAEMENLGADKTRIQVAVGPSINQTAYEVGTEFEAELLGNDPAYAGFFARPKSGSKPYFDLPGFVEARLKKAGIAGIERQSHCTYRNESLFYSFRRTTHRGEPDYGRQISAILVT
jgi:polyphenol oxidase